MSLENPALAIIFLFISSILGGCSTALMLMGRLHLKEEFFHFFFLKFLKSPFTKEKWDELFFIITSTKQIFQLIFALLAFAFFLFQSRFHQSIATFAITTAVIVAISLLTEFVINFFATARPYLFLKIFSPLISIFLLICAPVTLLLYKISNVLFPKAPPFKIAPTTSRIRERILEILNESELSPYLDPHDQKLILSVASFKDRIVREVMVPRIDVFSLSSDTTIEKAAESFLSEGYSRIPVYKESVDHIIGVLIYKEVLSSYVHASEQNDSSRLHQPIASLLKPVIYSPETKKISHLLQEFRLKKAHMAIVVDEYGGTEGIVTIEDILEELVGEIADEYDIAEEELFSAVPAGGWIVDAKMNIIDIEEDLAIKIPQSSEYDTIGGYIFHRAGAIPVPGWRIHHDEFDLEVLSSNERSLEKIRITPHGFSEDRPSS